MTGRNAHFSSYRGFPRGLVVDNVPVSPGYGGKVFWVGNNASTLLGEKGASNQNDGSFLHPFSTIDYAIGQCAANRGDIIYVRPNHTTTATAADTVDADVAGISIIGLGNGTNKPRIDYTGASGEFSVGADNVLIQNFNFHANVTGVTNAIDVEDAVDYCTIRGCTFTVEAAATDEFTDAVKFTNNNTGCVVEYCEFDMALGGAVSAIYMDADTAGTILRHNIIQGDYSTACIVGDTTLSTNVLIEHNLLVNGGAGNIGTEPGIELLTGTTGIIRHNDIVCNLTTPDLSIVADTCIQFNNRYSETIAGADATLYATQEPDSAYNFIGVDDSNNVASTTNVAANEDGSILERLEQIQEAVNKGTGTALAANKSLVDAMGVDGTATTGVLTTQIGTQLVLQKTLTSSAVVQAGVDVTGLVTGGDLLIEDIVFETNATGLAAGTNFTLEKNGGSGLLTFFSETVANLGANKTESLGTGSVVAGGPNTLASGQKLVAKCTVADCTGAGTITLTIKALRLSSGATVAAA